jgi:Replication protein
MRRPRPQARLDPVETPVDPREHTNQRPEYRTPSEAERTFRHSGWLPLRRRIDAALRRTAQSASRVTAFNACGCNAWVLVHDSDASAVRIACDKCHDRFCVPCSRDRSYLIRTNLTDAIEHTSRGQRDPSVVTHRFVTLTLRSLPTDRLADLLDRLYDAFRRLRQTTLWRRRVRGGAAICEVKRTRSNRWHPHLHVVMQGRFLPKHELQAAWSRATNGSYVVDIRKLDDARSVARYVSKYVSKGIDSSVSGDDDLLDEAVIALKGRRLLLTFGSWRKYSLLRPPSPSGWKRACSLDDFMDRLRRQDPWAIETYEHLESDAYTDDLRHYVRDGPAQPPLCLTLPECRT